jgi:hypothetical protein
MTVPEKEEAMEPSYPDVIPMIAYEDGPRAMDWLSRLASGRRCPTSSTACWST